MADDRARPWDAARTELAEARRSRDEAITEVERLSAALADAGAGGAKIVAERDALRAEVESLRAKMPSTSWFSWDPGGDS